MTSISMADDGNKVCTTSRDGQVREWPNATNPARFAVHSGAHPSPHKHKHSQDKTTKIPLRPRSQNKVGLETGERE